MYTAQIVFIGKRKKSKEKCMVHKLNIHQYIQNSKNSNVETCILSYFAFCSGWAIYLKEVDFFVFVFAFFYFHEQPTNGLLGRDISNIVKWNVRQIDFFLWQLKIIENLIKVLNANTTKFYKKTFLILLHLIVQNITILVVIFKNQTKYKTIEKTEEKMSIESYLEFLRYCRICMKVNDNNDQFFQLSENLFRRFNDESDDEDMHMTILDGLKKLTDSKVIEFAIIRLLNMYNFDFETNLFLNDHFIKSSIFNVHDAFDIIRASYGKPQ